MSTPSMSLSRRSMQSISIPATEKGKHADLPAPGTSTRHFGFSFAHISLFPPVPQETPPPKTTEQSAVLPLVSQNPPALPQSALLQRSSEQTQNKDMVPDEPSTSSKHAAHSGYSMSRIPIFPPTATALSRDSGRSLSETVYKTTEKNSIPDVPTRVGYSFEQISLFPPDKPPMNAKPGEIQRKMHTSDAPLGGGPQEEDASAIKQSAQEGVQTPSSILPYTERIQRAFGHHDVSQIQAHLGPQATARATRIHASAYTTGNHVVFAGRPNLHTVAHEAAHVVQQRSGVQLAKNIGKVGDRYETHADAVADRVTAGQSVESLLDQTAGGQSGIRGMVQNSRGKNSNSPLVVQRVYKTKTYGTNEDWSSEQKTAAEEHYQAAEKQRLKAITEMKINVTFEETTHEISLTLTNSEEQRHLKFSLGRHHPRYITKGGKAENSLYAYKVTIEEIKEDCEAVGKALKNLWMQEFLEPQEREFSNINGRVYKVDIVGSGWELNHFYVIEGKDVFSGLSKAKHDLIYILLNQKETTQKNNRARIKEAKGQWTTTPNFSLQDVSALTGIQAPTLSPIAPSQQQTKKKRGEPNEFEFDPLGDLDEYSPKSTKRSSSGSDEDLIFERDSPKSTKRSSSDSDEDLIFRKA
jgi:hypothetical protein